MNIQERKIPNSCKAYARSALFNSETVPDKLLKDHKVGTKTWGRLVVEAGSVSYFLADSDEPVIDLYAGQHWVILPQELHYVRLSHDAEFYVEFHKQPT